MNALNELLEYHKEQRAFAAQYIIWARQFVPEDAIFEFDPSVSANDVFEREGQLQHQNSS
ncbi:MAG: hypothetical protein OXH79_08290 [Boseongicola sp.]|nr:hypothetical protein [Boseongicola sp.]